MPDTLTDTLKMPIRPSRGEVILAIHLSEIKQQHHWEVLDKLVEMGYNPELRVLSLKNDDGTYQVATCALLKFEKHDAPLTPEQRAVLDDDFERLSEAFPDEDKEGIPIVQLSIGLFPEEFHPAEEFEPAEL